MKAHTARIVLASAAPMRTIDVPVAELEAKVAELGLGPKKGTAPAAEIFRDEMWDQPIFRGLAGPMYGGDGIVRYEDWAANDRLSR